MTTDHSQAILALRSANEEDPMITQSLAADLLEYHDRTSLSLDNWDSAREFVEMIVRRVTDDESFVVHPNEA